MVYALYTPDNYGCRHTLRTCNIYGFSKVRMITPHCYVIHKFTVLFISILQLRNIENWTIRINSQSCTIYDVLKFDTIVLIHYAKTKSQPSMTMILKKGCIHFSYNFCRSKTVSTISKADKVRPPRQNKHSDVKSVNRSLIRASQQ
jgi:hypothetical protein